jgi:glycosyltransferase involved in cell wall biosynthesis
MPRFLSRCLVSPALFTFYSAVAQHILLFTSPAMGGVLQYNHSILLALAGLGYRITYVQEIAEALVKHLGTKGMEQVRQRANWFVEQQKQVGIEAHHWLEAPTVEQLQQMVANVQPDLVLFSNGGPITNFYPKRAAIQLGIPFLIVEHLVHPIKPKGAPPEAYAELAQQYVEAKAVIAVSEDNLRLLRKLFGLPENKGQVIYCGRPAIYFQPPDPAVRSRLRQQWDIPPDAVVCFTAARMDIVKGYQYQVAAIKQLKKTSAWAKLYFVWAGTGTLETQFKQSIQQAGVADRVKFLGELATIDEWLDTSDIFVLPSESEGLPLAIMEAMAKGLPVAASAVSGVPEALGDNGKLLTSPIFGDPQATIRELAETLQHWAADAHLRQQIGLACRQRAEQLFREERMIEQTMLAIELTGTGC